MNDLLPCPFCGGAMEDRGYGAIHVEPEDCPIGDLAIDREKWNRRALPAASQPEAGWSGMGGSIAPKLDPNCECVCHRQPGVMHVAPCCQPQPEAEPVAWHKPDAAERKRRNSIGDHHNEMLDAQGQCVPCRLCGGKAIITDAGPGLGYSIECENAARFSKPTCLQSGTRISGWAYNVSDLWNRLNTTPAPVVPAEGLVMHGLTDGKEGLGRFGWHPDPVIDFEIEIEKLESRWHGAVNGLSKPGEQPETIEAVAEAIDRAMDFRVGGREDGVIAKNRLRELDNAARDALRVRQPAAPVSGVTVQEAARVLLDRMGEMRDALRAARSALEGK